MPGSLASRLTEEEEEEEEITGLVAAGLTNPGRSKCEAREEALPPSRQSEHDHDRNDDHDDDLTTALTSWGTTP
jgi:hypothetical protein